MEDFKAIVKQIYESDETAHFLDFKYCRFFTKLELPKDRKYQIRTKLLTIRRNGHLLPILTCYMTPISIMVADCAIKEANLKRLFNHLNTDTATMDVNVELNAETMQYLPNITVMMNALTKFAHEQVPYSIKNDPGLAIALSLIESIFEGFWTMYEQYSENPDQGMTIVDGFNSKWIKLYACGFIEKQITEAEKKFIAFMIVLSIFRPFNDLESAANARKKRYQVINSMYDSLPDNQDEKLFDLLTMQHIAKYFSKLPKLKSMILSCAILMVRASKNDEIHDYLLKMLIPTEMIMFIIIDEFVCMPEKTKAHYRNDIIREIHKFLNIKQKLKERFGDNYYFAKLLDPKLTDVNVGKWKHLGALAMMSANVKYPKTEQLKILGLKYEIDFPELLINDAKLNTAGRVDSTPRDSDLLLKAMYGN